MKKNGYLILTAIAAIVVCTLLIIDSEGTIYAVKKSVYTCLDVIIPSLFACIGFHAFGLKAEAMNSVYLC